MKFLRRRSTALALSRDTALALRRRAAILSAGLIPLGLIGCDDDKKVTIVGTQIPVLPETNGLEVSPAAPPVSVPAPVRLAAWPQVVADPTHAPGNVAGPSGLNQSWRASIGTAGGYRQPLQASPLVADGRVLTMDANGNVAAYATASGSELWRCYTRPKHNSEQNIGGGIGYDNGIIYAATGYSELLAIDTADGHIKWRQPLDLPARAAPTIAGGLVAVITQSDFLLTFDPASGTPGWRFIGKVTDSPTGVSVTGPAAFDSGILVAGFSSGTLAALDVNSGTPLWEQSFASAYGQASTLDFSDIVGAPVIANGVVYAIGLGNTMQAIDLRSGNKVWSRDVTGNQTICAAGGFIFVLDINQNLTAIHADDGLVSWMVRMPAFKNAKKKKNPIAWAGPIMVNGLLVLTNDHGEIGFVDPVTGALKSIAKLAGPADMAPIAAAGMLLVLTRDATLTAYS